jgi:hypothetical protein
MTYERDRLHKRRVQKIGLNRDQTGDGAAENWWATQCGSCNFYCPLRGSLGADWGACTSPDSPFDAQLRFEHDGCEHHQPDRTGRAPFR